MATEVFNVLNFKVLHDYNLKIVSGIINRILSSKIFIPFSRLTYAAYLIHFNYIKFVFSNARQPTYADKLEIFLFYTSVLLVSFSIAAVVSIVVEIPFLNADRLLLSKNNKGNFEMH